MHENQNLLKLKRNWQLAQVNVYQKLQVALTKLSNITIICNIALKQGRVSIKNTLFDGKYEFANRD